MPTEAGYNVTKTGYQNAPTSLAGIHDYTFSGRSVQDKTVTVAATSTTVLNSNPWRIWALLINIDASIDAFLRLGEAAAVNTGIYLKAGGGWCLIDASMPWTGEIRAIGSGGTPIVVITEVSLSTGSAEPVPPLPGNGGNGGGGGSPNPTFKLKC